MLPVEVLGDAVLALPALGTFRDSLACGRITPSSASVIKRPLPSPPYKDTCLGFRGHTDDPR